MWLITDASLEDLLEKRVSSDAFLVFKLIFFKTAQQEVHDQSILTYA